MIGILSEQYESSGDPACVSDGYGDAGGISYGLFQLSSNAGSVQAFIQWTGNPYGVEMAEITPGTDEFTALWKQIAESDPEGFAQIQHDYIQYAYYEPAIRFLADAGFHIANHAEVMQDVIWSRGVQYGPGLIVEMFETACKSLGYDNLSYVDDARVDADMIKAIYLTVCKSEEWTNGSPALREGLYARFESECEDALNML